jgi:esterase/lipase superfamily enzyme
VPGLHEERHLAPLRAMALRVVATGSDDANVQDSVTLAGQLGARGVDVRLDLWPGWQHDWPYWQRMLDRYL